MAYAEYTNATVQASYAVNYLKADKIRADVARAREEGADCVVVMVHWGQEYITKESESQRMWAKRFADAGVDILLGAHPHVVQPAAWIESEREDGEPHRMFVAYSMGNFISNQRTLPRDAGVIFDFHIQKDLTTGACSILEVSFVPTWVYKERVGAKNVFSVLPAGKYMEETDAEEEEGIVNLTASHRSRMRSVWKEITARMEPSGATPLYE